MEALRVLARLNEATQPHHTLADSDVDRYLFKPDISAADYRAFLARVYGFLLPVESALALTPGLDEVIDVQPRAKAVLVVHDLMALGMTMTEVNELRQCETVPTFRGPAEALGWMYVIERPVLASAVLRGHLATYLRAEMAFAASYLSAYAGQVGTLWRELGQVMDRIAYSAVLEERIIASANQGFRALQQFQRNDLAQRAAIRIAG
jgi:heme oxygenase